MQGYEKSTQELVFEDFADILQVRFTVPLAAPPRRLAVQGVDLKAFAFRGSGPACATEGGAGFDGRVLLGAQQANRQPFGLQPLVRREPAIVADEAA